jgi:hypothetical protein
VALSLPGVLSAAGLASWGTVASRDAWGAGWRSGLQACHLCGNAWCIRLGHIVRGTFKDQRYHDAVHSQPGPRQLAAVYQPPLWPVWCMRASYHAWARSG